MISFLIGLIFGCWLGIFIFAIFRTSSYDEKEGEEDGETKASKMDKRR